MGKRDAAILEILTVEKRAEVSALAEALGVSSVTMRKDLDELESRGIIQREHGFAVLGNPNDINGRLAYHYGTKLAIAERASELITKGQTIMVESGSCCALLARALQEQKLASAIVTNSTFIADYTRKYPTARTILLGGIYENDSQVCVGPMIAQLASDFYCPYLFIGVDGYTSGTGFTNSDPMRAQACRDMALQAEQVIVLTESEKFARHGVVPLRLQDKITTVITDDRVEPSVVEELKAQNVDVLLVEAVS